MEQEYIVGLKNKSDLDDFYTQMEENYGSDSIPSRKCECAQRRTISRNTHYKLTDEEVEQLRKDPRVSYIQKPGRKVKAFWEDIDQTYSKEGNIWNTNTYKNWGLKRCVDKEQSKSGGLINWGSGDEAWYVLNKTSTIRTTSSGKNVDVVICDSHVNPDHPEFAVNPDGTGGSRVNQLNWFSYNSAMGISGIPDNYLYSTSGYSPNVNHGTHVAGIAAGNRHGWARDSNIYNIDFTGDLPAAPGTISNMSELVFDYVRYFHKNKAINPITGRRNPTIMNNSWGGVGGSVLTKSITAVSYLGNTFTFTDNDDSSTKRSQLYALGIQSYWDGSNYKVSLPQNDLALDADVIDAMNDGVIVVCAAGNDKWNLVTSTDPSYNDMLVIGGLNGNVPNVPIRQGDSPCCAGSAINVGNIGGKVEEYKREESSYGPRVDIWAPGSGIISAVYDAASANSEYYPTAKDDPRDSNYALVALTGTSMASPQVAGYLACLAEQEQNLTQDDARNHLFETSTANVGSVPPGLNDVTRTYSSVEVGGLYDSWCKYTLTNTIIDDNWTVPASSGTNEVLRFEFKEAGKDTRYFFWYSNNQAKEPNLGSNGYSGFHQSGGGSYAYAQPDETDITVTLSSTDYMGQDFKTNGKEYYTTAAQITIRNNAKYLNTGYANGWSLEDSPNRYLAYQKKRPESGVTFPHENYKNRKITTGGVKYPRTNNTVYTRS